MARGEKRFEFDYELGGVVRLNVVAVARFGEVVSARAYYNGKLFDPDGIVIDWQDEFLPMAESLLRYAKQYYHAEGEENA